MATHEIMTHVYRHSGPHKGRLCRVVELAAVKHGCWHGRPGAAPNVGGQLVSVEFEDGETARVARQAIVLAASLLGRQTLAKVARGGRRKRPMMRKFTTTNPEA